MNIYPRSRVFILENIKKNPSLSEKQNWDELIPDDINDAFYISFNNQFDFFINHEFTVRNICSILGISSKTYYLLIGKDKDNDDENDIYDDEEEEEEEEEINEHQSVGRPPLITEEEEECLLNQILICQEHGDCLSPKEVRNWMQNYALKQGKFIILDRQWWFNFKSKYKDILLVMKIHSLESKRFDVSEEEVYDYFNRLKEEVNKCPYPPVIINVDESGFIKRPLKNKSKNCVFRKDCPTQPCFRDSTDGNHVSVVASVTLSGVALPPLLISTTQHPPKEVRNSPIGNKFLWYCTTSGYLNEEAMIYWIEEVLIPYLKYATKDAKDEVLPLLLFDNLKAHLTDRVTDLLEKNNIRTCCLPPHSSHLLQVLDLSFFGSMKCQFKNIEPTLFKKEQKMACKIEKILKAYYISSYPTIIIAGWEESGFNLIYSEGIIIKYSFNEMRVISKLIKH